MAVGRSWTRTWSSLAVGAIAVLLLSASFAAADSLPSDPLTGFDHEAVNPADLNPAPPYNDIAVDGNHLVVGSGNTFGEDVSVFHRQNGEWSVADPHDIVRDPTPDGESDDSWGTGVAIEGNTLAVAEAVGRNATGVETGAVHIYTESPMGWLYQTNVTGVHFESFFGRSVALENDTLVVGSSGQDRPGKALGVTHVYHRDGGNWTHTQTLAPPTIPDGDFAHGFGWDLAFDGTQLAVGAMGTFDAYIYQLENGTFNQTGYLAPPPNFLDKHQFPALDRVALDDDTALTGFAGADLAFGYHRENGTWNRTTKLTPNDDPQNNVQFIGNNPVYGSDVALADGHAYVGAPNDRIHSSRGNVYVYETSDWSHEETLRPPNAEYAFFGRVVEARSGELFATDNLATDYGSLHVFGPDADDDRLSDRRETQVLGSDPMDPDTDGDLYSDGTERLGRVDDTSDRFLVRGPSDPTNPTSLPTVFGSVTATEETEGQEVPVADDHGPIPRID